LVSSRARIQTDEFWQQNAEKKDYISRSRRFRSTDHSRTFYQHPPEEDNGDKPEQTGTLGGNHSGRAALRRKQREQLESNHRETSIALGKERNGDTPISYSGRAALKREQCGICAQSKNCGDRETAVASERL
jgi:hypothetical protein